MVKLWAAHGEAHAQSYTIKWSRFTRTNKKSDSQTPVVQMEFQVFQRELHKAVMKRYWKL